MLRPSAHDGKFLFLFPNFKLVHIHLVLRWYDDMIAKEPLE